MNKKRGYVALMSVILVSLVLLSVIATESATGFHLREVETSLENLEEARFLAEGCREETELRMQTDRAFSGFATSTRSGGTCSVTAISGGVFQVEASVGDEHVFKRTDEPQMVWTTK
jgi:hypothetical protein